MAYLEPLVFTNQLKHRLLASASHADFTYQYDDSFDVLMVKFVSGGRHSIHYLQGDFAALVEPEQLEIVGFWFENFKSRFLVKHPELNRIWTVLQNPDADSRFELLMDVLSSALEDAGEALKESQSKAELVRELEVMFA